MNLTGNYSIYYALIGFDLMANDSYLEIIMDLEFAIINSTALNFSVNTFTNRLYFGAIKYITIFIQNQLFNGTITTGYFFLSDSPPYYTSTKIQ